MPLVANLDNFLFNRSGVLFQIGVEHFVITASHKLRKFIATDRLLMIPAGAPNGKPAFLHKSTIYGIDECSVDVAVITLDTEAVDALSQSHRFLRLLDIDLSPTASEGFYLLSGFPAEWAQQKINAEQMGGLHFLSGLYKGQVESTEKPDIHIVLGYQQWGLGMGLTESKALPDLSGMSGCGIWKVVDVKNSKYSFKLVS